VVDLESIDDPIERRRLELTNADIDIEEFEEFIEVRTLRPQPSVRSSSNISAGRTHTSWGITNAT
jgi:hypothetical protein